MPLLLRAIQASEPDVRFVSDLKARHITTAYQVLVRLESSKEILTAIRNAAGALVENITGHEQSPYPR